MLTVAGSAYRPSSRVMVCSTAAPTLSRAATPPTGLACCLRTGWCAARDASCSVAAAWAGAGFFDAGVSLYFFAAAAFFTVGILDLFLMVEIGAAFFALAFFTALVAVLPGFFTALATFAGALCTVLAADLRAGLAAAFFAGRALACLAEDFACLSLRLAAPCFGFAMSLHSKLWRCDRVL